MTQLPLHNIGAAIAKRRNTACQIKPPQANEFIIKTHGFDVFEFIFKIYQPVV
jgi:hypothetical protein